MVVGADQEEFFLDADGWLFALRPSLRVVLLLISVAYRSADVTKLLRGILALIGDTERHCNVTALPPNLESAYHEFVVA